jgi:protein-L-isoaspartate(D-aspartate) O-methyltransferase
VNVPLKNDPPDNDEVERLEKLVTAARQAGVDDPRLLDVMRQVPRAAFVPLDQVRLAYHDVPVPIPHSQVTTQPSLSARMIQALRLAGGEHVLEVGTGYGYQTALLGRLAAFVTSIERWADLADQARRNLAAQGIKNVHVVDGDGTEGVPAAAPYDAILVSAAFPQVPEALVGQLRVGGRLVQPIGPGGAEQVTVFERSAAGLVSREVVCHARFVRLYGRYGYR